MQNVGYNNDSYFFALGFIFIPEREVSDLLYGRFPNQRLDEGVEAKRTN